jgi:hypothetical protein
MTIYKKSIHTIGNTTVGMQQSHDGDVLVVSGPNPGFSGIKQGEVLIAPQSHENAVLLRGIFPFTAPKPVLLHKRTIGLGDRLGIATPGHIRVFAQFDAVPVFAQQSIRELNLTNRSFADVLDAATFAVFREDFQRGYGADGDHLKTESEIEYALSNGFTGITLDCSEYIRNDVFHISNEEVASQYKLDKSLETLYCNKECTIEGHSIYLTVNNFKRIMLIYNDAVKFAENIYHRYVKGRNIDFEISIDETVASTTPEQHFVVASELRRRNIHIETLAPRFIGEFQKGIDYIGDINEFEHEFNLHASIARHFGYKLSIHSGSDKFSIFPIIGRASQGVFHLKTSGTSWVEAMRVVAMTNPTLYREIHAFALNVFNQAQKYYHVTAEITNIPLLERVSDEELPQLFELNDLRQLIHITYGLILNATNNEGNHCFKEQLYKLWGEKKEVYFDRLERHIGKHLKLLYQGFEQWEKEMTK